jgi:hypothetical protein
MTEPAIVYDVRVDDVRITFELDDGRTVSVPTDRSYRLSFTSARQRDHFEIAADGQSVAWPGLGERIDLATMLDQSEAQVDGERDGMGDEPDMASSSDDYALVAAGYFG